MPTSTARTARPRTARPSSARPSSARSRSVAVGLGATLSAAALVLLAPTVASAHVHVTPSSTEAGATSELAFSFSHGCDGSPTTAVAITIPEEVSAVTLIANPGWDVAADVATGDRVVRFTADEPLADGIRETLELEVALPEDAPDGTVLAFPALQACEVGANDWSSADQESETPAPVLTIGETAAPGHGGEGADREEAADAAAVTAADAGAQGSVAVAIAIAALVIAVAAAALAAASTLRGRASR